MAGSADMAFRDMDDALAELVTSEERYVKTLNTFRTGFLAEIQTRNTEDRRKLYYGNRALMVAYELIHIVHAHNQQLLRNLQQAKGNVEAVAHAFLNFASAEKAYSVYSANLVDAMAAIEKGNMGPLILKYAREHPVAGGMSVQRYLGMPIERFPQYTAFLQVIIKLAKAPNAKLNEALQAMEEGLKHVTEAVDEYKRQNDLINLQSQFMGYVDLYAPDRRLLKEGMLTKIYIDGSKRKPQERYIHLLSDALIYSTKLIGPYNYKLAKIHSLEVVDSAIPVDGDATMFDVIRKNDYAIRFQAADEATAKAWMKAITAAAGAYKTKLEEDAKGKPQQPREARVNAVSFLKKHGLHLDSLPERSRTIVYGIKADLTYIEYLKVFARVLGVTLEELSRGIGAVGGKRGTVESGDLERANGLFETKVKTLNQITEGTMNRVKAANAGKPLQSPEMAVFLKVLPILETLSQEFVERLEQRLTLHTTTGADLCIGDIYLDMSALFVAYNSYASMMPEAEKVLADPALAELADSLADELAPLTLQQHLAAPMEAAQRMAVQMKAVLDMTPEDHPDRKNFELATIMMEQTAKGMEASRADTENYWRLVAIRGAIASMELGHTPLDSLIDANRKLIMEGTLQKACRSKDKAYTFFLFSDALLYASNMPGGMYQLHRWINLTEMRVEASAQDKTGLDILTAEKSFTVFAKDEADRDSWLQAVGDAVTRAKEDAGISTDPSAMQVAPILVQTSDSNDCAICQQNFTLFMRKHHCMSCGNVVCDKCSPSRMLLPNIHKTQKQRVCNMCVNGETPQARSPTSALAARTPREEATEQEQVAPASARKSPVAQDFLSSPVESPKARPASPGPAKPQRVPSPMAAAAPASPVFAPEPGVVEEQAPEVVASTAKQAQELPSWLAPAPEAAAPAPAVPATDDWSDSPAFDAGNPFEGEGAAVAAAPEAVAPVAEPAPEVTAAVAAAPAPAPEPEPEPEAAVVAAAFDAFDGITPHTPASKQQVQAEVSAPVAVAPAPVEAQGPPRDISDPFDI